VLELTDIYIAGHSEWHGRLELTQLHILLDI